MRRLLRAAFLLSILGALGSGCSHTEAKADDPKAVSTPLPIVEVAEAGTRYDPPVQPSQIPKGAYYCDMGKVEYAAGKEGRCPVCEMKLRKKE